MNKFPWKTFITVAFLITIMLLACSAYLPPSEAKSKTPNLQTANALQAIEDNQAARAKLNPKILEAEATLARLRKEDQDLIDGNADQVRILSRQCYGYDFKLKQLVDQGDCKGFQKAIETVQGSFSSVQTRDAKAVSHSAAPELDLDKLSIAVACAETSCGKDGTARGRNNLHGIMCWPNGKRTPCWFASPEESHAAFKRIWAKSYKRFPDLALARKWTGNDHPERWLANVTKVYNSN